VPDSNWSIAVWEGDDAAAIDQALATCEGEVAAAYALADGQWSRWFAGEPELSNLTAVDNLGGILALGGAGATPGTPSLGEGWTKIEPVGIRSARQALRSPGFTGTVNAWPIFEGGGAWDAIDLRASTMTTVDETDSTGREGWRTDLRTAVQDWYQVCAVLPAASFGATRPTLGRRFTSSTTKAHKRQRRARLDTGRPTPRSIVGGPARRRFGHGAYDSGSTDVDVPVGRFRCRQMRTTFSNGFPNWGGRPSIGSRSGHRRLGLTMATLPSWPTTASDRWAQYNTATMRTRRLLQRHFGDWGAMMLASITRSDATTNFRGLPPGRDPLPHSWDITYTRE
jgi:hypothetical protein